MRKAQKTVKRQIKINEKKEIKFIEKPTESELDALSLKTLLLSLEIVIGNHQKVCPPFPGRACHLSAGDVHQYVAIVKKYNAQNQNQSA